MRTSLQQAPIEFKPKATSWINPLVDLEPSTTNGSGPFCAELVPVTDPRVRAICQYAIS
jgi:hypothetical protein